VAEQVEDAAVRAGKVTGQLSNQTGGIWRVERFASRAWTRYLGRVEVSRWVGSSNRASRSWMSFKQP